MKLFAAVILAGTFVTVSSGQVLLSGGLTYSQNFDSLASSSTSSSSAVAWADNTTLPGWYASKAYLSGTSSTFGPFAYTSYRVDTGTANAGWIYSYGVAGVNPVTDRALGSLASGTPKTNIFGVWIENDTASPVDTVTVSYTGEEWRNGGNTTVQTLFFSYGLSSTGFTSPIDTGTNGVNGWVGVNALNFLSPTVGATAAALDGNVAANRTVFGPTVLTGVTLNPGDSIFLRWLDVDDSGNDHGLAVDDLTVSASIAAPEPSTAALLGLLSFGALCWRRNRR
jgi:hypothetical protein